MTEAQIQAEVRLALGSRPDCRVWRQHAGQARAMFGDGIMSLAPTGAADLCGILTLPSGLGVILQVEIKTHDGRQSPEQKIWQTMIAKRGGCYILARSAADAVEAVEVYLAAHT